MLNIKVVSWALGLFGALTFVVCVFYGLATPEALHPCGAGVCADLQLSQAALG